MYKNFIDKELINSNIIQLIDNLLLVKVINLYRKLNSYEKVLKFTGKSIDF